MGETLVLVLRVALSLGVVLLLLWFLARRFGGRAGAGRAVPIDVLGRRSLGRRSGVAVVEIAGRVLVLGVSDNGVRLVADLGHGPAGSPPGALGHAAAPAPELLTDPLLVSDTARIAAPPTAPADDFASVLAGSVLDKATWARARQALTGRAGGS
jgi:flagellar protein FliO/FliZ